MNQMHKPDHPLQLRSCPKIYIRETHRSRTPVETFQFIDRTRELVGITAIRDATDVDRIGLPVFTCERIRPDNSQTSHTGKGISRIQAQVSLVMEAIERCASEFREEYLPKLINGSYAELKEDNQILDPGELILPQFARNPSQEPLHWIWGHDLLQSESILVPAAAVYHPFTLEPVSLINTSTNGLASGNTMEEAVFHGLTEVIERDAWSIARYRGKMETAVAMEDIAGHAFLANLMEKFEASRIEIATKDITTEIGVPVIAAFSQDLEHPSMMPVDGFGAHLDPRVAMARALMEVATTRALLIQKHGIGGLRQPPAYFDHDVEFQNARFFAQRQKNLGEFEYNYEPDILTDIEFIGKRLKEKGFNRIIVVDLTRPDLNVPTVRVIVPGMEVYCFDKSRRGDRLHGRRKDGP